jgi:putative ABC transport system permease protein
MIQLALRNLFRRPLRATLTLGGLTLAMTVLTCLSAFGHGYRRALHAELDHMGMQLMLVPLGCPYESAALVLKGKLLDNSLPESALAQARDDSAVAVAAPLLMVAVPRPKEGRTDMWVGLDKSALALKPWWRVKAGERWFPDANSVILGAEAAAVEMRSPGDKFFDPTTGWAWRVSGVLEHSGTSDDSLFFAPLPTVQEIFGQRGRLTAIAIRLHDPASMRDAVARLQRIPGAQVATLTEMMGTFLNLVETVRTMLLAIAMVAVVASGLGVFNTLMAAVLEHTTELSLMRAIGASRLQIFAQVALESLLLTGLGCALGLGLAGGLGRAFEHLAKQCVPLAPAESLLLLTTPVVLRSLGVALSAGLFAGLYPAWRASRMPPAVAAKTE